MFFSMMVDIVLHVSAISFSSVMFGRININLCRPIRINMFVNVMS